MINSDENSRSSKNNVRRAYTIISNKSNSNVFIQGLSGVAGFPFTLVADGAVVFTHYGPMINEIRQLYNRDPIDSNTMLPLIKGMGKDLLIDLLFDKVLGQIPIAGIYFNMVCAKTMTWRLGMLFSILSSRGNKIDEDYIIDTMKLVRELTPQSDVFKFTQPKYETFEKVVNSVGDNDKKTYKEKLAKALSAFS